MLGLLAKLGGLTFDNDELALLLSIVVRHIVAFASRALFGRTAIVSG
jgi:hypothetical protein